MTHKTFKLLLGGACRWNWIFRWRLLSNRLWWCRIWFIFPGLSQKTR